MSGPGVTSAGAADFPAQTLRSQFPALSLVWQSVQFMLSAAAKNPIVPINSFTGMPRST